MFDTKTEEIGLRAAAARMPNSFRLKPKGTCDNQVASLKPFWVDHDIRVEYTVRFREAYVEEGILVLSLNKMTKATPSKRPNTRPRRR